MLNTAIQNAKGDYVFLLRSIGKNISGRMVGLMRISGVVNEEAIRYSQGFLDGLIHAQNIINRTKQPTKTDKNRTD